MTFLNSALVRVLPAVPRSLVRRFADPYIAGATLADARREVAELNAAGKLATIDVLGEEITRAEEARAITQAYLDVLDAIDADGLDANVSVKLTGLGLKLDPALARREPRGDRGAGDVRPDRHGGLLHDRRDARALPRPEGRRPREPRCRPPGRAAPDGG